MPPLTEGLGIATNVLYREVKFFKEPTELEIRIV
jgi:hypothetical protein